MASSTSKATEKEIEHVLDEIANGRPLPKGFAYNGQYDPPVWRISGPPSSEHLTPPGVDSPTPVVNEGGVPPV